MQQTVFPVIDPIATGKNIIRLREDRGLSVRDLQTFFGFEGPQAIYKWQHGKTLPSVDNLYALSALLDVPMDEILIPTRPKRDMMLFEQQADACCSVHSRRSSGASAWPSQGRYTFLSSRSINTSQDLPGVLDTAEVTGRFDHFAHRRRGALRQLHTPCLFTRRCPGRLRSS